MGYFAPASGVEGTVAIGNFIHDIRTTRTFPFELLGEGNRGAAWRIEGNSMLSLHISEMPPRKY